MSVHRIRDYLCPHHALSSCLCFNYVCCSFCRRYESMVRFFPVTFSVKSRRFCVAVLAFAWIAGLISGALTAYSADLSFISMMRRTPVSPASIVGLLLSLLLPFLLSAIAFSVSQHWLLILISFLKGLFFSCISSGIVRSYGSAGWLLNTFLLFSDSLSLPVLFWFWIHVLTRRDTLKFCCFLSVVFVMLVCCVDFRFISPFLADLLTYVEG